MTIPQGFLDAILADSEDDTPRLILADWLDERDDPRGEFIRVQCTLAKMPALDRNSPAEPWKYVCEDCLLTINLRFAKSHAITCPGCHSDHLRKYREDDEANPRRLELQRRERELWSELYRDFDVGVIPGSPLLRGDATPSLRIRGDSRELHVFPRRGFIAVIECDWSMWLDHADHFTSRAPIQEVRTPEVPYDYDLRSEVPESFKHLRSAKPMLAFRDNPTTKACFRGQKWYEVDPLIYIAPTGSTANTIPQQLLALTWPRIKFTWPT